jgi:hypothetical protein
MIDYWAKIGIINAPVKYLSRHIYAGVAQLAEQRFRKARVGGSTPLAGFLFS